MGRSSERVRKGVQAPMTAEGGRGEGRRRFAIGRLRTCFRGYDTSTGTWSPFSNRLADTGTTSNGSFYAQK